MKNSIVYQLVANVPILFILYPWLEGWISTGLFVALAFVYAFLYRPVVDYYRLVAMGEIKEGDLSKMWKWGGFYRFKYYNQLMFGK